MIDHVIGNAEVNIATKVTELLVSYKLPHSSSRHKTYLFTSTLPAFCNSILTYAVLRVELDIVNIWKAMRASETAQTLLF